MLRYRFVALVALAVLLVGAIAAELASAAGGEQERATAIPVNPRPIAAPAGQTAAGAVEADAQLAARRQEYSRVILERPLFSPSRRPNAAVAAAAATPPRLAGIILGPTGDHAIFAGSGDARAVLAGVGAQVGPYQIRAISAGGVDVTGPDGRQRLLPHYDAGATSAGAAQPGLSAAPPPGGSILDMLRARLRPGGGQPIANLPGIAMPGPFRPQAIPTEAVPPPDANLPANANPSRR